MIRTLRSAPALVAACILAACSSEDDGMPMQKAQLETVVYSSSDTTVPVVSHINDAGDRYDIFATVDNDGEERLDQVLLTAGAERMRIYFDEFGQPKRIQDEATGQFTVSTPIDGGLRFDSYSVTGQFIGGIAIVRAEDGTFLVAPVLGSPAFDGQIVGQLLGSLSGSFSVTPDENAGLGPFQALPPELVDYLLANDLGGKSLISGLESIAEVAAGSYLALGAVAGGAIVLGGGTVAAGAATAATAALVGFAASLTAAVVRDGIITIRSGVPEGEGRDMFDSLFGTYSGSMTANDVIQNAIDEVRSVIDNGRALVSGLPTDVADFVTGVGNAAQDNFGLFRNFSTQPAPVAPAPRITTPVNGFGVDSQSRPYRYSGQVMPNGTLALTGQANDETETISVTGSLDPDGNIDGGTYTTGSGGGGNVVGNREDFGECAVVQQAGGQGTFSFSHDVGSAGTAQFSRQAFNIPDAFDVFNDGISIYSTGGLVSGTESVSLSVTSRFVSVNVSAPQSGTAWEYVLGCAQ